MVLFYFVCLCEIYIYIYIYVCVCVKATNITHMQTNKINTRCLKQTYEDFDVNACPCVTILPIASDNNIVNVDETLLEIPLLLFQLHRWHQGIMCFSCVVLCLLVSFCVILCHFVSFTNRSFCFSFDKLQIKNK